MEDHDRGNFAPIFGLLASYSLILAIESVLLGVFFIINVLKRTEGKFQSLLNIEKATILFFFCAALLLFTLFASLFLQKHFWAILVKKVFSKVKINTTTKPLITFLIALFAFAGLLLLTRFSFESNEKVNFAFSIISLFVTLFFIQSSALINLWYLPFVKNQFARVLLISCTSLGIIWLFAASTGVGLVPDKYYWNVAAVPVLALQVTGIITCVLFIQLLVSFLNTRTQKLRKPPVWMDILLGLIIWIIAFQCWHATPFGNSFFFNGPLAPNNDLVPFSDAAYMDLGGQYMLIGEGLQYPLYTEKVLYVFFLGLLHLFAGQSYLATTSLQIAVFALFPVLIYFLGAKFTNRLFGIMLAAFAIIKEHNALLSTFKISVSNSRLYMTEFPTALMMLALGLVLFLWFRQPEKKYLAIIAGGILGFSTLIRTNPLVLIPFLLGFLLLLMRFNWRKWFKYSLLLFLGFVLAVGPWTVKDQITYDTNSYFQKIQGVVNARFLHQPSKPNPTGNGFYDHYLLNTEPPSAEQQTEKKEPVVETDSKFKVVVGHFLNNEIKTLFTLPYQISPTNLDATLSQPYWREPDLWKGDLPPQTIVAFALNLILIAVGVAFAWRKWRFAGLVPLMLNVGYYLSNALGRTSGSRYLLPVDWVTYFYYLAGIYLLLSGYNTFKQESDPKNITESAKTYTHKKPISTWVSAGIVLLLGISLPVINASFPKLYPNLSEEQLVDKLANTSFSEETGYSIDEIKTFVSTHDGVLIYGRLLYPRVQDVTNNIHDGLMFTVLSPEIHEVYIPQEKIYSESIPAGQDVLVLGCQKDLYIEAISAYLVDSDRAINNNQLIGELSCK